MAQTPLKPIPHRTCWSCNNLVEDTDFCAYCGQTRRRAIRIRVPFKMPKIRWVWLAAFIYGSVFICSVFTASLEIGPLTAARFPLVALAVKVASILLIAEIFPLLIAAVGVFVWVFFKFLVLD